MTLVGHDQVVTFFDGVLSKLARGGCRFVEVVGEPGTGKTQVLREVCRLARLKGIPTWYGRAGLGTDRHTVRRVVRALLAAHADMDGLLLVLDDMDSADEYSVALVASLLRTPPRTPMLVVTASRPGQLLSVAFDEAVRDGTACRVTLDPENPPNPGQERTGNEGVVALLVAAARRVRDHTPNTAAQCLRVALRLLPPEATQDRLELELELAHLVTMGASRDLMSGRPVPLCVVPIDHKVSPIRTAAGCSSRRRLGG